MSEMIERVAQAVLAKLKADDGAYQYCDQNGAIEAVTLDGVFDLTELVGVAIAAMREPTHEMFLAMERAGVSFVTQQRAWPAAIDAALGPEAKG